VSHGPGLNSGFEVGDGLVPFLALLLVLLDLVGEFCWHDERRGINKVEIGLEGSNWSMLEEAMGG
jgi:hypothetical protein